MLSLTTEKPQYKLNHLIHMAFLTDFYKNIKQNFMIFYKHNVHARINYEKLFTALSSQSETL